MDEEPVLIFLGGAALVVSTALLAANALEWTHLDADEIAAIVAFITVFAGLLAAGIRGQVYSPATHKEEVGDALYTPVPVLDPEPLPRRNPLVDLMADEDID